MADKVRYVNLLLFEVTPILLRLNHKTFEGIWVTHGDYRTIQLVMIMVD